ncbi:MAG: nuclear transport factor 2 family protein [Planctomycetes bacterium]|nr:nuclear transport factor 2 family protein [Planctomycetota bacterium]
MRRLQLRSWTVWFHCVRAGLRAAVCGGCLAVASDVAIGADSAPRAADEAAIRAAAAAYVAALGKGDTETLASLWTADGDIVDAAGNVFGGRDAVALDKEAVAAGGGRPEFRVGEMRLRFLSDDVAIEDGTVDLIPPEGEPLAGRFSATWLRQGGGWKLAALREARGGEPGAAEALADLEWMVGDWVVVDEPDAAAAPDSPTIEVSCRWNATKTYLTRVMMIPTGKDSPPLEIRQQIGWDPLSRSIHSWAFGSDGSHGEAVWSRDGRSWVAQARAVQPDGGQSTSLNVYTFDGKDRCAWRSLPTHVGGEHVPPVNMTMVRKAAAGGQPRGNR